MKTMIWAGLAGLALSAPTARAGDIVDVAAGNPDFSTLVAAVQAADLVGTLKSTGPFTVFAPTNEAFAALPAGMVDKLLMPANKDLLAELLTFHVVSGKVLASGVVALSSAATVQGEELKIQVNKKGVRVNNVNVIATDVLADNGVIHVVDGVLLPKAFVGRLNSR
jgi:uncharacterized surface protein with fasciclin (FAS1) repeats